jgi:hypothetical protein
MSLIQIVVFDGNKRIEYQLSLKSDKKEQTPLVTIGLRN